MEPLKYQSLSIDGPPGCNKNTIFSQLKGLLFKHGWLGLPLMSDLGEAWTSYSYEQDSRIQLGAHRILRCPKERTLLLDFVGFIEARKANSFQVLNYGLGTSSDKILKVVILPEKESNYSMMSAESARNNTPKYAWEAYSTLYDGYKRYVSNNERRLLVIEQRCRPAAHASKLIIRALKGSGKDAG